MTCWSCCGGLCHRHSAFSMACLKTNPAQDSLAVSLHSIGPSRRLVRLAISEALSELSGIATPAVLQRYRAPQI